MINATLTRHPDHGPDKVEDRAVHRLLLGLHLVLHLLLDGRLVVSPELLLLQVSLLGCLPEALERGLGRTSVLPCLRLWIALGEDESVKGLLRSSLETGGRRFRRDHC